MAPAAKKKRLLMRMEKKARPPRLVADEARKICEAQGLPGTLVLTTSVNAAVAKKGSLAYDTSKAAANHLVRELAIELSPPGTR
jgi:NAD(P)-dependent dehydrogenase (short-subunit alcohol dehydrogenase family)